MFLINKWKLKNNFKHFPKLKTRYQTFVESRRLYLAFNRFKPLTHIYHHCYILLRTGWRNYFWQKIFFASITCKVLRFLKWCKFHEFFLFFWERRDTLALFYFRVILFVYYLKNISDTQIFARTHNWDFVSIAQIF